MSAGIRIALLYAGSILGGLLIGGASAWLIILGIAYKDQGGTEAWRVYSASAATERNPYALGALSLRALLPMRAEEARYFMRITDEAGRLLTEGCSYILAGGPQPARWWSMTLYRRNAGFASNDDAAHSIDAYSVPGEGDQGFIVHISPTRPDAGHWISSRGAGEFELMLRLYGPSAPLPLPPSVRRVSCHGDEQ